MCAVEGYDLTLSKPLGIVFEEGEHGGLVVKGLVPGGTAQLDGTIWPGDDLLSVGGCDLRGFDFDSAMAALASAPTRCKLGLGRTRGRAAAVRFDGGGKLWFAAPGDALRPLAQRARFEVEYSCSKGTCGTCEMFLRDGETDELRPVRMCQATLPMDSSASLMPWEVLHPDSPEAIEYFDSMKERFAR